MTPPQPVSATPADRPRLVPGAERALRSLANDRACRRIQHRHSRSEIVGFTSALLELVTSEIKQGA